MLGRVIQQKLLFRSMGLFRSTAAFQVDSHKNSDCHKNRDIHKKREERAGTNFWWEFRTGTTLKTAVAI